MLWNYYPIPDWVKPEDLMMYGDIFKPSWATSYSSSDEDPQPFKRTPEEQREWDNRFRERLRRARLRAQARLQQSQSQAKAAPMFGVNPVPGKLCRSSWVQVSARRRKLRGNRARG